MPEVLFTETLSHSGMISCISPADNDKDKLLHPEGY